MKYCSHCGYRVADEARFCNNCGANLNNEAEVAASAMAADILSAAPVTADTGKASTKAGPRESSQPNIISPIPTKPQRKGLPEKKTRTIIIGIVVALLLAAGGFWGWRILGSEARLQQKLDLAVKYLSENKFEEAILQYNELLKIDNKNLKAYKGLGKTFTIQGNYDEAEKTYQAGLAHVADKNQLKLSMAGLYMDQGKNDLAEKTYSPLFLVAKTFIAPCSLKPSQEDQKKIQFIGS